jgi:hypothetical protein
MQPEILDIFLLRKVYAVDMVWRAGFCSLKTLSQSMLLMFTAVTMNNVAFWDIKTQFVLHRRHITSRLQS